MRSWVHRRGALWFGCTGDENSNFLEAGHAAKNPWQKKPEELGAEYLVVPVLYEGICGYFPSAFLR